MGGVFLVCDRGPGAVSYTHLDVYKRQEYGYLNDDSNLERVVKPAKNGETLELTIDANIQKICQKYIDEWQAGIGSKVAAVIVMDPNTAEILAMDTNIRYDLNDPYNMDRYYTQEEQAAMDEKTKADAWYKICLLYTSKLPRRTI